MVEEPKKGNPGFQAFLGQRSKIERLAWAWKGASKKMKERRLNAVQAVTEARSELYKLKGKLRKAGQGPDQGDVVTALVFAKKDDVGKLAGVPEIFSFRDASPDARDLEVMRDHLHDTPVGLVIVVLDRENKNLISHARPWILEAPALKLLEEIVEKSSEMKELWTN